MGDAGTCSIEGCDYPAKGRGWCQAHYMRWWATGDTGPAEVVRRAKGRTCSLDGCDRKHQGRGYCDTHLVRFIKYGDPGPAEIEPRRPGALCSIDGCGKPIEGRGWCNAHYLRWRKFGDPLTPLPEHGARWIGDAATYYTVHGRLRKVRGPASAHQCSHCERMAHHWAYDYTDPNVLTDDLGRPYSLDLERYFPLCGSCHRTFDVQHGATVTCAEDGCERPQKARGLCNAHYQRARRAGALPSE